MWTSRVSISQIDGQDAGTAIYRVSHNIIRQCVLKNSWLPIVGLPLTPMTYETRHRLAWGHKQRPGNEGVTLKYSKQGLTIYGELKWSTWTLNTFVHHLIRYQH